VKLKIKKEKRRGLTKTAQGTVVVRGGAMDQRKGAGQPGKIQGREQILFDQREERAGKKTWTQTIQY